MGQDLTNALKKFVEADRRLSKEAAESLRLAAESMHKRQKAFEEKKKSVQEEIDRGSRVTKHRISL